MNRRTEARAQQLLTEATQLHRTGQRAAAEQAYVAALALSPDAVEALRSLAAVRSELGRPELALDALLRVQRLRPNDALAQYHAANALLQQNRGAEALVALQRAVALKPNFFEAHLSLAQAKLRHADHDGAIAAYGDALRLRPESSDALIGLCDVHLLRFDWQSALAAADSVVQRAPGNANALYVKGGLLGLSGRIDDAEAVTRAALAFDPTHAGAYSNLGAIAMWRRDYTQSVADYRHALELRPEIHDAQSGLAYALLAQGEFEQGWAQHERSRPLGVLAYTRKEPVLWDGTPMPTGTLTLFCEAGLGDVLQFCRLVPRLKGRVGRVVLYLQPYYLPLARLLATLDGVDQITADAESLHRGDACLSLLSLPYLFNVSLCDAADPAPYLRADAALSAHWAECLRDDDHRPRVGLVWGGNPRLAQARISVLDRRRSVPLSMLEPLLATPAVSFYCLQKGIAAEQLQGSPLASRLVDRTAELGDFADTAALIEQLDLTITVDTSVAHLAGALGKPVWMLNRFDSCWRWGPQREDAPWYPTLRIFRQPAFGDWASVVERVAQELRQWPARRSPRAHRQQSSSQLA
ncbi:MAG: tetratricopeptide repeat protein [Casimicrobiaceae bacterium]